MPRELPIVPFAALSQFVGASFYVTCSFATGVVLLRESGSLWLYAGNAFLAAAIVGFMGPIFGTLADRYGRIRIAIAVAVILMLWLLAFLTLVPPARHLYASLITTLLACFFSSCMSVTSISLPGIVSGETSEKLGASLSKIQIAEQIARVAAPMLLLILFPLTVKQISIFILLTTSVYFVAALLYAGEIGRHEQLFRSKSVPRHGDHSLSVVFSVFKANPFLKWFAPYLAVSTACVELSAVALTPVVLSFTSEGNIGTAFAIANFSAVVGSICISRFNKAWSDKVALSSFLAIEATGGVLIAIEATTSSFALFATALAFGFLIMPASLVAAQCLWLGSAPPTQHGVISGLERFASWVLVPFAFILGPVLAPPIAVSAAPYDVEMLRNIALCGGLLLTVSAVAFWFTPASRMIRERALKPSFN